MKTSMPETIRAVIVLRVVVVLLIFGAAQGAAADDGCYDPTRVPWQSLSFKASKLGVTARASVAIETLGRQKASRQLTQIGAEPLEPTGPAVVLTTGSSFLGRTGTSTVLLDAGSGQAFESLQRDGGKRHRIKIYRFGRAEIASRRVVPADSEEAKMPSERWTEVSLESYAIPSSAGPVSEPSVLLYIVSSCSEAALREGRELILFSDKQLSRVTVKMIDETTLDVEYGVGGGQMAGEVQALRLAVRARPLDSASESRFEMMGLEGDIDVYIDKKTRVPLKISGRISPVGRVNIKLEDMTARTQTARANEERGLVKDSGPGEWAPRVPLH
jgi:hypothetical protein